MRPIDAMEAFIEQHEKKVPLEALKQAFERSLQNLGIRYFACCSHGDPLGAQRAPQAFLTYPQDWVRYYSESCLYRIDPVFRYADTRMLPFLWDDAAFRATLSQTQENMLSEAAVHGIGHGYTVPIHPPGGRMASCSVIPASGSIDRAAYQAIRTMACFMYDAMIRADGREKSGSVNPMQLSDRERQCVELAAQGKDDWSIGSLLSISERTAHNHIERAKRRFGVGTRVQVIVHALSEGQISFGAVIKATRPRGACLADSRKKKSE